MSDVAISRKNYWSLDIAKFCCAILIISAHFASETAHFPTLIDYAFSLYVIAVPFFFCCSGFLFFKKWFTLDKDNKKKYFIKYQKRIWIMYGLWSALYNLPSWILKNNLGGVKGFLKWLHTACVMTTYPTIWFLPALAVGIAVTCFLKSKFNKKAILIISIVLYVFGMLGYTYKFLLANTFLQPIMDAYLKVFITSRNGLFNGVPFIVMGMFFACEDSDVPELKKSVKYFAVSALFLGLIAIESFALKLKFNVSGMDIGIFIVPFIFFFFKALLNLEIKENKCWLAMRKLSLLIFVSQRLFLTFLPSFFPTFFGFIYQNSYIGLGAVLLLTITFSVVLIKCSEKIKFLKHFI